MNKNRMLIMLLLFIVFGSINTFSQRIIDFQHNSLRLGDVVKKHKIITEDIWDLSQADECDFTTSESYEDFKTDTITRIFNGMREYFVCHSDSLLYVGSESPIQKDSFYLSEISCVFPMSLGDKHEGYFAGYIDYCDKMRFHKYGIYSVHVDSIGTLTLPNGNNVNDVLQVCRKRNYMYDYLDMSPFTSSPQYNNTEILQRFTVGSDIYTEVERELYANGYRYPIVKDFVLYNPQSELCTKYTYYYPTFEQEYLPLDESNLKARMDLNSTEHNDNKESCENILSFVSKHSESMEIVFDCERYMTAYPLNSTVQCTFLLSDSKGIVYRTRHFSLDKSNAHEVVLSYSGLRPGQYIISLIINDNINSSNFIASNPQLRA